MCGVAGIYNFRSFAPVDRVLVERMTHSMTHRGPDDEGFYFSNALGLGHRRLSILDISDRGHQPMCSTDGRLVIVYNGEVYNYVELRAELESSGHVFRTGTDTEVILALYARHGHECLQYLNGMFAFAIWDSAERSLLLVRDRLGIKPLYYAESADGIMFASEIKALIASGLLSAKVNVRNIDKYLEFGYVPGEETLFQGVRRIPPGHWLRVGAGETCEGSYWALEYAPDYKRSSETTAEELRDLLLDAMRIELRSDVPVGVFLSGGLDSSTTVALLAEAGFQNLRTFSVAHSAGGRYDETYYARLIADQFQTDHHVLYVNPVQFLDCIPQFIWHMDEPVAEAPALSFFLIARLLREYVTVALSGEGADELFGGYGLYRYMCWIDRYRRVPGVVRSALTPILEVLATSTMRKYLRLAQGPSNGYRGVPNYDPLYKEEIYTGDFRATLTADRRPDPLAEYYSEMDGRDVLTRMLFTDLKTWLVDDLLIKADRMTMANSVELRVPFLDHRVVEYAATIPSNMKIRRGAVKWILKQAMTGRLPRAIINRTKMGFPTPIRSILKQDLCGYLRELLLSPRCLGRGYFKRDILERLITENSRNESDHHRILWQLVVLEEWHRTFIDRPVSVW
jgi:asparagine synthase (glutamine-hydrolysing)